VLSAPWFSREALAQYGRKVIKEMRPEWARFFETYDPNRHPPSIYRRSTRWRPGDRPLTSPE